MLSRSSRSKKLLIFQRCAVADFYFEVNDSATKWTGGKHFVSSRDRTGTFTQIAQNLLEYSDRVWCEQEGKVWFVKHRIDPTVEVDMKEFMWIKLKAQDVR